MALTDHELDSFTFNHADQVDEPTVYTPAELKTNFDSRAEELRVKYNALIAELVTVIGDLTDRIEALEGGS